MDNEYDVVIIGGGPAGSSAAIRLSRSGRRVLLIDKAEFPRHKLCGEFVSPECLEHFSELGVHELIQKHAPPILSKTVFHSSKGRSLTIANKWLCQSSQNAIGISRFAMDNILLRHASKCGSVVRENTSLIRPKIERGRIAGVTLRSIDGRVSDVRAHLVIDATGRGRYLARHFDRTDKRSKARQVAFKAHVSGPEVEYGACELFSFDGGYGGCSEVEAGLHDLCFVVDSATVRAIGSDPLRIFEQTFLGNKHAAQVFRNTEIRSEWLSVPLARYGTENVAPFPGVLAIGDAAAFNDPFTGSGIAMALESSKLACEAIAFEGEVSEIARNYRAAHAATFNRRLGTSGVIRYLSRSQKAADLIIRLLSHSEIARHTLARMTRASAVRNEPAAGSGTGH